MQRQRLDEAQRLKLARYFCTFIKVTLRNRIILLTKDMLTDLQAFCIEFSKIQEATQLFRLLKEAK